MSKPTAIPSVSVTYAQGGTSTKANALGMRPMQERAYNKRGEQYLLIKSPPVSGKSRALMFIALDKLENQGIKQAIIHSQDRCHRRRCQKAHCQRQERPHLSTRRGGDRRHVQAVQYQSQKPGDPVAQVF